MKQFREFLIKEISAETQKLTELLVDQVYSKYVEQYDINSVECVGWLDGTDNARLRFQKIYEAGISEKDSILDVGCRVAHINTYLKNQGWTGKYLGFDPNKKAIDLVDESINVMHGTIEDLDNLPEWNKFDWAIANGVFNLGLKKEHSFWFIENMISHANKGIIFNMLCEPYEDDNYESYKSEEIKRWLKRFDHRKIEIVENYMRKEQEFTVYFYNV